MDQQVKTEITANAAQANREFDGWAQHVAAASATVKASLAAIATNTQAMHGQMKGDLDKISSALSAVQSKFAAWAALVAGGMVAKASIDTTVGFTKEAMGLGKALGINTQQASVLNIALGDIYSSSEVMTGAASKLAKQLRTNEDDLKSLGLTTRDASGNFRNMNDLMMDSIRVLNGYEEGTDRTMAMQVVFGKGAEEVGALLKLNNEVLDAAAEKQRELGLVVGVENVEATKRYRAAMNDVGDVLLAVKKTIGDAVMPIFTKMGEWFSAAGPAAVVIIKGAIGGLVTMFWGLKNAVAIAWEILDSFVFSIAEPVRTLAEAIFKLVSGDFKGAADVMMTWPERIGQRWSGAWKSIVKSSEEASGEIYKLFADPTQITTTKGGGKKYVGKPEAEDKDKKENLPPSFMAYYEAALEEEKRVAAERDALHEYSKTEELAFWRNLLANADLSSKDRIDIQRKASKIEIEILRDKARQAREINAIELGAWRDAELAKVEMDEQAARNRTAQGMASQEALLLQEQAFELRRREIKLAALQESLSLLDPDRDAVKVAQMHAQIEALEQQHQQRMAQIKQGLQAESNRYTKGAIEGMASGFEGVFQRLGTQIKTLNQLFAASVSVIVQVGMQMMAKMAADWLKQQLTMLIYGKTMALSKIAEKAGEAGAGGVASMAAAPFPLNLGAPAFGAAMAAAAMAFAPVASASMGFDIPAGLNPMTQLHAREMVLPAQHADVIRALAQQPALLGGGGGGDLHLNVRGASAGEFFMIHKRDLVTALRSARKDLQF